MLNIPNCLNNSNIPLELSLTAPYKSIDDLKMIAELTQISCERLREYDISKITQVDVDTNSCNDMQTKFSSLKKFCGVCKFSDSNVLGRLDDELVLLNHIFNHGPDGRINGEQFKYYFLDQSNNVIAITSDLYNLMTDNYGAKNDPRDILISYSKDNEFINIKAAPIIEKVMNSPSTDIDRSIQRLNKTSQRKNPIKHTDVLSLLISNQKIANEKKVKDNKTQRSISEKNTIKKTSKESNISKQVPGQLNLFEIKESHDNSPISIKESSESLDDCNRLISDSEHNYEDSAADRENNGPSCFNPCITVAEINALSIVCGTVFISADDNLSLTVQRDRDAVDYYKLDYENKETIDFIVHLLMNKNVLKIVNDLEKLKKFIDLKSINSTFDISLASTESNFIDFYNNTVKNYSIKQFESFKAQNTLKILKTFNTSDDPNVIFRVDGHHKFFDEILINAHKSKLFEKFMVKVCKSDSSTLELQIDHNLKSLVVDYFLTIIRSELKKSKLFSEIEVIIR